MTFKYQYNFSFVHHLSWGKVSIENMFQNHCFVYSLEVRGMIEQEYSITSMSCEDNWYNVLNEKKWREAEMLYIGQFVGLRQGIQFKACMIKKSASAKTQHGFWSKWLKFMYQNVFMFQSMDFSHLLQHQHCDYLSVYLYLYADFSILII